MPSNQYRADFTGCSTRTQPEPPTRKQKGLQATIPTPCARNAAQCACIENNVDGSVLHFNHCKLTEVLKKGRTISVSQPDPCGMVVGQYLCKVGRMHRYAQ